VGEALVFPVYNNAINHFDQVNHIVKGQPASVEVSLNTTVSRRAAGHSDRPAVPQTTKPAI